MPASLAFDGYGVVFKIATVALTDGEIYTITDPSLDRDIIETSHAASPSQYKEFIGGFREGGLITVELAWTQTDFKLVKAEYDKDVLTAYTIEIPDPNYVTTIPIWGFSGIMKSIPSTTDVRDKKTMTFTIQISGVPTFTDGTTP